MSPAVNPPGRAYDNSRRAEGARTTRKSVVDAARDLFLETGYATTSLAAIAERAEVSVQTVYAQFGNKRAVLKEVIDQTVAGDDRPVPIGEREDAQRARAESDPLRKMALLAQGIAAIVARTYPIDRMLRSAAVVDAEAQAFLEKATEQRRRGMLQIVEHLAETGLLRRDLTPAHAADRLGALIDPEVYRLTVLLRNWSREQYEQWLAELFAASLLERT